MRARPLCVCCEPVCDRVCVCLYVNVYIDDKSVFIANARKSMEDLVSRVKTTADTADSAGTMHSPDTDQPRVWVYPLLQMGPWGVRHDETATVGECDDSNTLFSYRFVYAALDTSVISRRQGRWRALVMRAHVCVCVRACVCTCVYVCAFACSLCTVQYVCVVYAVQLFTVITRLFSYFVFNFFYRSIV